MFSLSFSLSSYLCTNYCSVLSKAGMNLCRSFPATVVGSAGLFCPVFSLRPTFSSLINALQYNGNKNYAMKSRAVKLFWQIMEQNKVLIVIPLCTNLGNFNVNP